MTVEPARFREVLGHFATGVTVVTALEAGVPAGFTCQAFSSLSLDPPMVVLAPAKSSTSWPRMAEAGHFCVNILADDQQEVSEAFAVSGRDKFEGVRWHAGVSGAPVLEDVLAWAECALEIVHDAGDHELVIGKVIQLGVGDRRCGPLLRYRGTYGGLAT